MSILQNTPGFGDISDLDVSDTQVGRILYLSENNNSSNSKGPTFQTLLYFDYNSIHFTHIFIKSDALSHKQILTKVVCQVYLMPNSVKIAVKY